MIKEYVIINGKLNPAAEGEGSVIIYIDPDEKKKRELVEKFAIDEHTLSSALDPDELARIEFEPEHNAIIFKRPKNYSGAEQFLFLVSSFGMFWYRDKLIIVISEDINFFEGKIFNRVTSIEDVVLKIMYATIHHYLGHLKVINMISDSLEQKINTSMQNEFLINLFSLEKSLVYYLNAINSNGALINRMKQSDRKINFSPESLELIDDIRIENEQCYKQAEIYSNILAGLMDARVSIVSNNLNILMKKLNIFTIAIMVPTFVVSAFSMNVRIPLSDHTEAFYIILGLALLSVGGFYLFWRYKKW
jgi:magnesium transporter